MQQTPAPADSSPPPPLTPSVTEEMLTDFFGGLGPGLPVAGPSRFQADCQGLDT